MTRKAYISYSRRSDSSLIPIIIEENEARTNGWEILYDETDLETERSIEAFEEKLSESGQVIFLLSQGYFESHYCVSELLKTYRKRAKDLLPIIIFISGYTPDSLSEEEVVEFWKQQGKSEIAQELPNALAWLLGKFNSEKGNWDTLFSVCAGENDSDIVKKALDSLVENRSPRFMHFSCDEKNIKIDEKIRGVIRENGFRPVRRDFEIFLDGTINAESVKSILRGFVNWLRELESETPSSSEKKQLAAKIKELTGWLVLTVVDNVRLHQCIHWLNRQQKDASLEIRADNDSSFQLIVSAISNVPVFYNPDVKDADQKDDSEPALTGAGELVLHERGVCAESYYQRLEEDLGCLDAYRELENQMSRNLGYSPGYHADLSSVSGAMESLLEDKNDFYLLLNRDSVRTTKSSGFRKGLNEKFPNLQQVLPSENEADTSENYFLPNLNSGYINSKLIAIYTHIERLKQ